MKCARCSAEIPRQSQFCLRCGTPVSASATVGAGNFAAAPSYTASAPRAGVRPLIAAIVVLLLALGAVGAAYFMKPGQVAQKPGQSAAGSLVQAPAQTNPGSLVQAPAETKPTDVVQAPPAQGDPFPSDVDDYLKFLKRIEMSKQQLIRSQTGDALLLMTQVKGLSGSIDEGEYTNTFGNMKSKINYSADDWNKLTVEFNKKSPPASCIDLRNKYLDQLAKIQSSIIAVTDALSKVQSDPSAAIHALTDMQGKSSQDVDSSVQTADDSLNAVCSANHLRKDFDIRSDSGSSGLLR